ncbi:MAG TPA: cytochrome c [Casimicrobiaceae bacterium]|jgi:mono/diheme cytochrome c family protein|nr:cytochrome c [Casimicrobiaceae bacterium]
MKTILLVAALALAAGIVAAQERKIDLKEGPGKQQVEANCGTCHSLDYIVLNSPNVFVKGATAPSGWEVSVTKMIKVFGAPISPEDAKAIVEYLDANYGKS